MSSLSTTDNTFVVEALLNLSHVGGGMGGGMDDNSNTTDPRHSVYQTRPTGSSFSSLSNTTTSTCTNVSASASASISTSACLSSTSTMQMRRAIDIVQRYHMRGKLLPHQLADRQQDPVLEQEHLDAQKLSKWRQNTKGLFPCLSFCMSLSFFVFLSLSMSHSLSMSLFTLSTCIYICFFSLF